MISVPVCMSKKLVLFEFDFRFFIKCISTIKAESFKFTPSKPHDSIQIIILNLFPS